LQDESVGRRTVTDAYVYQNREAQRHIEAYGKSQREFIQSLVKRGPTANPGKA